MSNKLKTLMLVLVFFLFFNICLSQLISPLYFQLINENKNAAVSFLTKIKLLPEFQEELTKHETIHGENIREEVYRSEIEQKQMINKLEQILEKNPKSRDVLFSLFLVYDQAGNKTKAEEYLRRAREIDPTIKN